MEDLETGLSPTDFWYNYALPLGHTAEAVKYAICALGAAHRAFKFQDMKEHPSLHELRNLSVQQYNQAIHCVKAIMEKATTEQHMEIILSCCVIFISIENLHGRYAESLRHLKAGTSLLISLMSKTDPTEDLREFEGIHPDDRATNTPKFLNHASQALCRLGNDAWGYARDMIAPDLNFDATTNNDLLFPRSGFTSVGDAEQSFHNVAKLFEADRMFSALSTSAQTQSHSDESQIEVSFMTSRVPAQYQQLPLEELKPIFNHWSERFDLFRLQLDKSKATSQEVLRTRALAVDQALWTGFLKCDIWTDYQQDDYEEILRRAESLVKLDAFQTNPVFAFDGSLIMSLAIPSVRSMDCDLQWRAIRLLRSFWRREGMWDSQELADILEAMMIAKSRGMVTEDMLPWDIPHLARLLNSLQLCDVKIPQGPLLL
ncbi:uncharacterized protein DNG_09233 [Cephalotrichum gorgonifer]|uniref:Uncharacterized protein n=1 Tax=Cephalotrichum gorgonifer TaxID=2041049 RepID=A0AAE8N762_9PEZI|nr:uncharacterized protein DNG_09233 [Cephalotrichum gorgonifer]